MDFSPGYVDIEVTCTVRKESTLQSATEVNREGVVVASISSAGFMPVLIKSLTRAKLVRTGKIFDDIVEEYRNEGLITAEDEMALKQGDDLAMWAERRAKAFEAAAQCIGAA